MATYKSKTTLSINIVLPSGKSKHISFTPITEGGSVYYTNSEDDIAGLEKHPKYGKLFSKQEETPVDKKSAKKPKKTPASDTPTVVTVACEEDAKTFLCEQFGFSRTKLKLRENIISAAKSKNIVFEGL